MLRKRSRPTAGSCSNSSSKQGLVMSEPSSPSPSPMPTVASLFPSPRLFATSAAKIDGAAMSPTSILESKSFTAVTNPFFADRSNGGGRRPVVVPPPKEHHHHHRPWQNGDSRCVGLGIVDALKDEVCDDDTRPPSKLEKSRMVLLGSQLKIQIPPLVPTPTSSPTVSVESPRSPIEFGIKTKTMVLGSVSPVGRSPSPLGSSSAAEASPRALAISTAEMELSEDYTCVIVHGPNPKTTHIFDNCIVEMDGHADDAACCALPPPGSVRYASDSFLRFCYACKKALAVGEDMYMYRGDRAFCSNECRYQEMLLEEGTDDKCTPVVDDDELY